MLVESPPTATIGQPLERLPDAGVIEDARSRQRRHRRVGACLLVVVALGMVIASFSSGGGGRTPRDGASVANGGRPPAQGATLRLPGGHSTTTFTITAPAAHAYDVTMTAPAASAIVLTMKISPGVGWTVNTLDDPSCHTTAGHTACLLHFAEGGNPGGTWTAIVHKNSPPPTRVHISILFARTGDSIPGKVNDALETVDTAVLLWSADADRSKWVRAEFEKALARGMEDGSLRVSRCYSTTSRCPRYFAGSAGSTSEMKMSRARGQ